MAGLGRVQQMFNRGVLGILATLFSVARGGNKQATAAFAAKGHPILAKLIKSSNPNANTPGRKYAGYCSGDRETQRRYERLNEERMF